MPIYNVSQPQLGLQGLSLGTKDKQTSLNNSTHSWGSPQSKTLEKGSHPSLQGAQRGLPRDWVAASPEAVSVCHRTAGPCDTSQGKQCSCALKPCKSVINQYLPCIRVCDSLAGPRMGKTGIADPIASPHAAQRDLKGARVSCGCPGMDELSLVLAHVLCKGRVCFSREAPIESPALSPWARKAQLGTAAKECCFRLHI